MKKFILPLLIGTALALSGCAESKVINGTEIQPYGIVNEDTRKVPGIQYEIDPGNVILAIIFCETIFIPVYIVGWKLYEPVRSVPANS